jgi:hypothetical protein
MEIMATKGKTSKGKTSKGKTSKGKTSKGKTSKGKTTKARTTKGEKRDDSSGILKAGGEVGVGKGDSTLGKLKAGAEIGVESDHSLDEIKEKADDAIDNIKAGFKALRKKI